jgi:hypothetical protein
MLLFIYCIAVILFCAAFYLTKIISTCVQIISVAKQAATTIADKSLDDDTKENAARSASIKILTNSFILFIKIVALLGAAVLPLYIASFAGLADFSESISFAMRMDVLLITTFTVSAAVFIGRKFLKKK